MLNSKTDSPRIPQRLPQRGAAFLTAIAVGVGGLLVAPAGAHAEPTPVIEGLEGEGTAEAPLILDSAADLDLAAEAVNGDYASFGSLNYRLDADIDYGGGTFDAFARFSGVFDGNGHTISDVVYASHVAGNQQFVSFFVELNGATVTGLTLDDVTAVVSSAAAGVTNLVEAGGLARNAIDSTIDGNTVRDATVSGPDVGNGYNSGFIARASGSTVSNNMIAGAMRTTGDKYASAFLGYLGADTVVEKNLIAADPGVTYTVRNTAGGDNNSSGVLVDYVGANMDGQTIRGNVVYSGSVYAHATGAFSNLGWVTAVNAEQVEEYGTNLVNARNNRAGFPAVAETAITDEPLRWTRRSGAGYQHDVQTASGPLWRPGDEGTPVSHAELQEQPTYEALGWDFGNGWRWDAEAGHPVLQSAPSLTTQRSSLTIAVGADRSESEILEALGAASDRGALSIDLAGVDFAAEGVYTAEVVAAEGRFRSSAPVEITITSLPFVTVAETSASFRVGSAPTAAEVLEALGAAADRGELAIDLSGVDFAALGSYDAVVTATDGGAVSQPVAVSIAVVPLSGAGTAASPFRIDSAEDLDAAVALVNADAAGTGAAKAHYRLTEDIDYSGGSFTPFAKFSGIFDGGGRTVRDLAITAAGNPGAGFFVELVGGTVTGLTLADLAVTNSVGTSRAGAIAATASGATVRGNTVLGSTVTLDFATGSNNGQAGGIVGSAGTGTVISDNLVINSSIRGAKYAAGIVAYPLNNQGNAIRGNLLVDTTVAARAAGSGSSVGMLLSQGGAGTEVSGNVVIRGGIGSDNADVEHVNVAPRDVTATTVNYASAATALTQKGDRTATSAQVAELPAQPDSGTFAGIGWDLGDDHGDGRWAWDASRGYPVLVAAVLPSVAVEIDLAGGANGGIGEGGAGDARHGYGATTKLVNPTREHYGFAGWTGTGITGTASDVTLPRYATDDLAYTATWAPTEFTIGYDLAGGSSDESGLLVYTVETGAFELVAPSREGYRFAGWTGTGLYGATAEVTVPAGASGNRAYTATWEPIAYDLEIDLAGGEPGDPNQSSYTVETDSFLLVNPTRIGYWFAGWTGTGADEPTMRVTIARGSTGDRAYTATWTPISYHVIYGIADDEEFSDDPVGSYTIESDAFTLPVPVRAGYTFAGWTGTGLDGPTRTVTVPVGSVGERSYVPTWSVTEYSIGYRLAGGKAAEGNPTSYTVESSSFTLRKPTRTNYSFAGWSGLGAKRTSLTVPTGTTGDLTFTATWKKKAKTKAKVAVSYVKKTKKQKNYSRVNVAVSRVAGYSTPTGTVKVTVTGKVKQKVRGKASTVTVTRTAKAKLSSGSVRVSIPKGLKPGTYKLKVAYHGNSMYQKSNSKTVALKIKRK